MVFFQGPNVYSYRQYESHSFMRKCRSMELLWKMQLPLESTHQVNVFTYSTLKATLRAPLQSSTSLGGATCCYSFLYVPELVYLLPVLHASNKMAQVFHGNVTLVYVMLPEFCPEFPLLLCIISGILDYVCNRSCLHLDNLWQVPPLCMLATIAVLYPISFVFQI